LASEEIVASRDAFLAARPDGDTDLWLFAYGSLMWKPELEYAESRLATARGWHRRFCLWQWRYRGSRDRPGLMLALDRGGSCRGLAYKIQGPDVAQGIARVWRREMIGIGYRPRWLRLHCDDRQVRGLAFVVNPQSPRYAGRMSSDVIADHIAMACGATGPSAEYLLETHEACRRLGIRDEMLERLPPMVAERLHRAVQDRERPAMDAAPSPAMRYRSAP
jgi:cation transport protein ChaC